MLYERIPARIPLGGSTMKDTIYITKEDYDRLRRLVEGRRAGDYRDAEYLNELEVELDRAEIVDPSAVPRDVVTMGSEIRLKDLDTKEVRTYRLVFPAQVRGENAISVLAPIGTAMLGYQVGDVIEWRVPKGLRRLKVLKILYQPEREGVAAG
jgi:regulator of nucleoside diphosphate kinase